MIADDAPTDFEKAIRRLSISNASAQLDSSDTDADAAIFDRRDSGVPGLSASDNDGPRSCKGAIEVVFRNSQKGGSNL